MVKVVFLGVCSGQNSGHETTSFVLDSGEAKVLVDTGPGVVRQLDKAQIKAEEIDAVIVTHQHGDHTSGFPYFMFTMSRERAEANDDGQKILAVIALPDVYKGLMDMFAFAYPPGKYQGIDLEYWPAEAQKESHFRLKNIEINTMPVSHAVPCIGVRFDVGDKSITFSSDTAYDKNLVALGMGSDLLIHEGAATTEMKEALASKKHSSAQDAGVAAREAGAKELLITHVFPQYMEKQDELVREAKKEFSGAVRVPKELEVVEL